MYVNINKCFNIFVFKNVTEKNSLEIKYCLGKFFWKYKKKLSNRVNFLINLTGNLLQKSLTKFLLYYCWEKYALN